MASFLDRFRSKPAPTVEWNVDNWRTLGEAADCAEEGDNLNIRVNGRTVRCTVLAVEQTQ